MDVDDLALASGLHYHLVMTLQERTCEGLRAGGGQQRCWLGIIASLSVGHVGCFYVDDLNSRPVVTIFRASDQPLIRGGQSLFRAERFDEESPADAVSVQWQVRGCGSAADCDISPFQTSTLSELSVIIPGRRSNREPVQKLELQLRGSDERGAEARPVAVQVYDVQNAPPSITALQATGYMGFPVDIPFIINAQRADADDDIANVITTWKSFSPAGSINPMLTKLPSGTNNPSQERYELRPDVAGTWTIEVSATDPLGATSKQDIDVTVANDQPPCITTLSPAVAPAGTFAIIDRRARYAVLAVADDLDVYPPPASDPYQRPTGFAWTIKSRLTSGRRVALQGAQSFADIDPALYQAGDQIELRVQVSDRQVRAISCNDDADTCSATANACTQRQTWHLEVR
jgi:hypothetical protein